MLRCADLEIDDDAHRVTRGGDEVSLSPTEYNLLRYLLVNQGRVLSKAQILDHVWQYDFGGDGGVVETYIGYLRRKVDHGRAQAHPHHPGRRLHPAHRRRSGAVSPARPPARRHGAHRRRARGACSSLITRTTQADLVDQVDAQLERAVGPARRLGDRGPGDGQPPGDGRDGGDGGDRPLSSLYVGVRRRRRPCRTVVRARTSAATTPPCPTIDGRPGAATAETGEPFTVGSDDVGPALPRAGLRDEPDGDGASWSPCPLDDVDDAVAGLVTVEALAAVVDPRRARRSWPGG